MTVLDRRIYDQDNYFRYVILMQAQSQNGFGGYVTDHYYITLQLDPSLNGMFTYSKGGILGIKFSPSDDVKNGIG